MIALGLSSPGQLVCTYSGYQQSGYLKFVLVVPGVVAEFFFEGDCILILEEVSRSLVALPPSCYRSGSLRQRETKWLCIKMQKAVFLVVRLYL